MSQESKDIVLQTIPEAKSIILEDAAGIWYMIADGDVKDKSSKIYSISYQSEEQAWNRAAKMILETFLNKLES